MRAPLVFWYKRPLKVLLVRAGSVSQVGLTTSETSSGSRASPNFAATSGTWRRVSLALEERGHVGRDARLAGHAGRRPRIPSPRRRREGAARILERRRSPQHTSCGGVAGPRPRGRGESTVTGLYRVRGPAQPGERKVRGGASPRRNPRALYREKRLAAEKPSRFGGDAIAAQAAVQ